MAPLPSLILLSVVITLWSSVGYCVALSRKYAFITNIHRRASEDFPLKSAGRPAFSSGVAIGKATGRRGVPGGLCGGGGVGCRGGWRGRRADGVREVLLEVVGAKGEREDTANGAGREDGVEV